MEENICGTGEKDLFQIQQMCRTDSKSTSFCYPSAI